MPFIPGLDDDLIAAPEYPHPRPAATDGLQDMPAFDGRLPAGMLGERVDLDEFAHTVDWTLRRQVLLPSADEPTVPADNSSENALREALSYRAGFSMSFRQDKQS
jgi:hypothetical protein